MDEADDKFYLVHKDAEGKDDTLSRPPVGMMKPDDTGVKKKINWTSDQKIQHKLAKVFLKKSFITSTAEHLDGVELDHYLMSFHDCNHDTPILGEPFNIKMGGVVYEVTADNVVKHAGVELPKLLFDADPTSATHFQLVGVKNNSKDFRSGHIKRVKALTSPKKKKRAPQMKFAAGGSAVSLD